MNAERRKEISKLVSQLEQIREYIEALATDEQDKFDNLSEGLQQGDKGQAIEEAASNLECAVSSLDDVLDYLSDATN